MRRLLPTLTDYVVIAINLALLMLLITSLIYFLLEVFYQGNYPSGFAGTAAMIDGAVRNRFLAVSRNAPSFPGLFI